MKRITNESRLMPAAIELVNTHQLATVISLNNDAQVAHLPLVYDEHNQCFYGHCAANNHLLKSLTAKDKKPNVKLIFNGAHAYVSPTWHSDIKVPTWDYTVVHVSGKLEPVTGEQKQSLLAKQVNAFENEWQLKDMEEKLKTPMLNAISVFTISADVWQAKFKLSQNKSLGAKEAILHQMTQRGRGDMIRAYGVT